MLHHVPLSARFKTALSERRKAGSRWMAWGREGRPPGTLVWVHAASVGEMMAAIPVLERLRAALPDVIVIHTFTSPSMAEWQGPIPVDRSDYAPQDSNAVLRPLFASLRPSAIVISRGDLWPGMVRCAREANVPVAVVGGMIRPGSFRLRLPGRAILNRASRDLSFVGAVTKQDAERWRGVGTPAERVLVTGDPRDARILERATSVQAVSALAHWWADRRIMVAGSTHAADERVLADMFPGVAQHRSDVGLLVVPHDSSRSTPGWRDPPFAWSTWQGGGLMDRVPCLFAPVHGALADLYLLAHVAYVGGGFDRGAHSVAEPAVYGVPVAAGPRAGASAETHRFLDVGAVRILGEPNPASRLAQWWMELLDDDSERWRMGLKGRALMDTRAARISADAIRGLIS